MIFLEEKKKIDSKKCWETGGQGQPGSNANVNTNINANVNAIENPVIANTDNNNDGEGNERYFNTDKPNIILTEMQDLCKKIFRRNPVWQVRKKQKSI